MNKLFEFMNTKFAPIANKVSKNFIVSSIQDAIMTILPLILVSSIVTILSLINEIKPDLVNLGKMSDFSFGIVGIGVAFLIAYNIMEKSNLGDKKLLAGVTSLSLFLISIGPKITDTGTISFEQARFGATGLIMAMIVGIFVGVVMRLFSKFSFFKQDSGIPDFVIVWFDSLIPITLMLGFGLICTDYFNLDIYNVILSAFQPLSGIIQTFGGFVLINFIQAFLYSFGISPWILTPIAYPVYMQAIADNHALVAAGGEAVNIATNETVYGLFLIGGLGATLTLVLLMAFMAKSMRLKAIGRATLIPSLFNINEPVIFGAPIAFNPFFMVGMWINGLLLPALAYLSMYWGFVNIPSDSFMLWYLPYPLQSFFATGGDWKAIVACFIFMGVSLLVWFPLFKMYDAQQLKVEADTQD
ncbi:PTS system transporter subunit IIC [Brochothrix campestris FSL F6-1037]|uniref:Permease IIC component n=2 Tax=Brochothrix campestris TaxID=2757 RepID=W7CQM3_9LIST|nr:PTS system transporter subunit IIC [Brochothrix campestris FSL F6-1037]